MSNIPNINSLHKEKMIKKKSKDSIFEIVLNKCVQKIIHTNKHTDQSFIYFEVPNFLVGVPSYDKLECISYLIKQLSEKNYTVEFIEPFYLYVDWGSNKMSHSRILNQVKSVKTQNPRKLLSQTELLLKKYPNTDKVIFEYEK